MTDYTHRYNRFTGYTLEDCACVFCLHYAGAWKPCPLDVCCCAEEKRQAIEKMQAAPAPEAVRVCRA